MGNRRKKTLAIGILCSLLVFMGIGYAILSQMLTIGGVSNVNGNWNIFIESITPVASGTATSIRSQVSMDKLSATFEAELLKPGDYVEYTVVVKNGGNIDAKLMSVVPTVTNAHEYVAYSNTAQVDTILNAGESMNFIVKSLFNDVSTIDPDITVRPIYELRLNFVQYDESNPSGGGEIEPVDPSLWTYEQIGETENYKLVSYTGDFDTDPNVIKTPNAITAQQLGYLDQFLQGTTGSPTPLTDIAGNANYTGYSVTIPNMIDNHPITTIGANLFKAMEMSESGIEVNYKYVNITSVTIPEGITTIENGSNDNYYGAFYGTGNLKTLTLPSTLTTIGDSAFQISPIENLTLPSNLTTIGAHAFFNHNLTSLTIPPSVVTINNYAFQQYYVNEEISHGGLTSLTLPENSSLTTIGIYAFDGNQLTSLTLPSGLTTIGNGAFKQNLLTTLTIPNTVTTIGNNAFTENSNLTSITVNRSATGMTLGNEWCGISDCTTEGGRVTYSE